MEGYFDKVICGIDEAGRGPLAGPVSAAALILDGQQPISGLKDSKTLSELRREALETEIRDHALAWGLGWASHHEIDELNIHRATLLAMKRAFEEAMAMLLARRPGLPPSSVEVLVDGKFLPDLRTGSYAGYVNIDSCEALVKGDSRVQEISGASILAKVARDRWMKEYHDREPGYGFNIHKGYPTRDHRKAITDLGPSAIQRLSFRVSPLGENPD